MLVPKVFKGGDTPPILGVFSKKDSDPHSILESGAEQVFVAG
jgi:hypothetical protein